MHRSLHCVFIDFVVKMPALMEMCPCHVRTKIFTYRPYISAANVTCTLLFPLLPPLAEHSCV